MEKTSQDEKEPHPADEGPELTVVVPVFNEEGNLRELHSRLAATLAETCDGHEVILVNDGSTDKSMEVIRDLCRADSHVRSIDFSRNFGHQAAFYAGIRRARGRAVVLMDGDLQDRPEAIPDMLARWKDGVQVVYAIRRKRKEFFLKRWAYGLFYRLLRLVSYVEIPLDAGDFALMDRCVVDLLCHMPERNKFLRGLRSWVGFRQEGIPVERDKRFSGKTKYGLGKLLRLALDGLVSYSYVPLRISFVTGLIVSAASFILALGYFLQRLLSEIFIPKGFTTLAILILFLGGIQLLSIGLLGEYLGRIYDEVKRRPEYVEAELIGFEED